MKKRLFSKKPKKLNGELVYEIIKKPVGIAVSILKESELHYHKKANEWYIVLDGKAEILLNKKKLKIRKNDVIHIKPRIKHKAKRIGKKYVKILVISYPPWKKKDHILVK